MKQVLRSFFMLIPMLLIGISGWALDQNGDVYQIGTGEDLVAFSELVNSNEATVKAVMTADIDMEGYNDKFRPIGAYNCAFNGEFDGQGHRISNLKVNIDEDCAGLFGYVKAPSTIKNLILDSSCSISGRAYCGMIGESIPNYKGDIYMTNLGNEGTVTGSMYNIGGIMGCNMKEAAQFHFNNCYTTGAVSGSKWAGALCGWVGNNATIDNCWSTSEVTGCDPGAYFAFYGSYTMNNCYCTGGTQTLPLTEDQVKSGELCFLLNQGNSESVWYQTLGEDAYPVFDSTHGQVYTTAERRCDGKMLSEGTFTNNKDEQPGIPEHQYVDGKCSVCGQSDPDFLKEVNGFYEIGNAAQLVVFASYVNEGKTNICGKLTADIDMDGYSDKFRPIGSSSHAFNGVFDGQGHHIGNLQISLPENCVGLFGYVAAPCTIENITLDSSCTITGVNCCGLIGESIPNVFGDIYMTNLGNEGDVLCSGENNGGIIGCNMGQAATFHLKNCYSTGTVTGSRWNGSISGWVGFGATIENCWSISDVTGYDDDARYMIHCDSPLAMVNCFTSHGTQSTFITEDQIMSGELCYLLNQNNQEAAWFQTIGEDEYPVLDASHGQVYTTAELRCDGKIIGTGLFTNDASKQSVRPDHQYENGKCVVCGMTDPDFMPIKEGFYQISNAEQLLAFANMVNTGQNNINGQLTADIDMEGYNEEFRPIGNVDFSYGGEFDGQGHRISNLNIALDEDCVGLFGYVKAPSTFKNLILDSSCSISGRAYCGMIGESIAGVYGDIYMINLGNEGTVTGSSMNIGAIVGCNMKEAATFHISNCYSTGTVSGSQWAGAISGWVGNNATIDNCWSTAEVYGCVDSEYFFFYGSYTMNNCYCTGGTQTLPLTADQVASGELCWKLSEGSNGENAWRQTLGEDAYPVLDASHGQVYNKSEYRCDGSIIGAPQFTNEYTEKPVVPDHQFENGFCAVCGQGDPNFMQLVDGYYIISSAAELVVFSDMVSDGMTNIKGKLSEDIDMGDYCDLFRPIGSASHAFNGEFDGQGHCISNLVINLEEDCVGLFGYVAAPCAIKNLTLDSSCSISGINYCGMIGESVPGAYGDIYMTNLGNEGSVICTGYNIGGIVGCNMKEAATFHLKNCYTTGPVSGCYWAGALSGWVGRDATIEDCWSTSEVSGCESNAYFFYFGSYTMVNCYCTGGTQTPNFDASEVETGQLAFRMNGDQTKINWYQTLGEDEHPVPYSTHGIVCQVGDNEYLDFHDESSFAEFKKAYDNVEADYATSLVAEKKLVDDYVEQVNNMTSMDDQEEFMAAYVQRLKEKKVLLESAEAYKVYQEKVESVIAYLEENDGFPGPDRDFLTDYLESDYEPGDEYPNGSYMYIINEENRQLTANEILAEIDYVDRLLNIAIQKGFQKGDEITSCLVNANFADGTNGWTISGGSAWVDCLDGCPKTVEVWNAGFDMYQTITDLKDGVYELQVNADSRFAEDLNNKNQTAFVYVNDNCTYLPLQCEDAVEVQNAQNMVNCYITEGAPAVDYSLTDELGNVLAYVPTGPLGHSVAYSAGRYANTMLAYVTDGVLRVGVKNPGMNQTIGTWFGNIHLYYRGTLEEATASLDAVLACQKERAESLYAFEPSTGADYYLNPNYSAELRERIWKTISAVDAANDAAAKYALVQEFSNLFQEAYDCKKAYITYMDRLEQFQSEYSTLAAVLPKEQSEEIASMYVDGGLKYADATLSAEEARNARFAENLSFYPQKIDGAYMIGDAVNLLLYSATVNSGETNAKGIMTADIDMAGYSEAFRPIGSSNHAFNGVFDGQGHHISNLKIDLNEDCVGLFGYVAAPCTIQNVTLDETCSISGVNYCGLIGESIPNVYGDIYMTNLGNEGDVLGSGWNNGGVIGCNMGQAATFHLKNCYSTGVVTGSQWCGSISGWVGFNSTIENCWSTAEVTGYDDVARYMIHCDSPLSMVNCYTSFGTQAQKMTEDMMMSGELCYLLNQGNTETTWYQTIGEDVHPVFDPTHGQVYTTAPCQCDGKIVGQGTFSNNAADQSPIPDHQFEDGICKVCGLVDPNFMPIKDGFYQISNAAELAVFASYVNSGQTSINGMLTADIDMEGYNEKFRPIGSANNAFNGVFNGQGHRISNLKIAFDEDCVGLFGCVAAPCTIENLILDSSCSISGRAYCGLIGESIAGAYGDIYMRNLGNEGTVTGTGTNIGAIMGCNMKEAATFHISNCYSTGTISGSRWAGAISGWVGNNATIDNCWSTAEVSGCADNEYFFFYGSYTMNNCYCTGGTQTLPLTADQVVSGELCYLLNQSNSETVWYQTLGEDEHPVFNAAHKVVMLSEDGTYYNSPDAIESLTEEHTSNGAIYNLAGQRVSKTKRGLYIIDGKKVLVK